LSSVEITDGQGYLKLESGLFVDKEEEESPYCARVRRYFLIIISQIIFQRVLRDHLTLLEDLKYVW